MTTALVTGASSGLGEHFAHQLAARGHDLILVARRTDRLEAVRDAVLARHARAIHIIAMDLSRPGSAAELHRRVVALGIAPDIVVNNAGLGIHGPFGALSPGDLSAMVDVNIRALTQISHLFLPGMIGAKRGAILNVASIGGFLPGPYLAVYYATKAYVLSLSEALHEEARHHGVTVTALCPGPTRTEFADVAGMGGSPLFASADDPARVVRAGLNALARRRAIRVTGMSRIVPILIRLTPRWVVRRALGIVQRGR